jgi:hypothetical protein
VGVFRGERKDVNNQFDLRVRRRHLGPRAGSVTGGGRVMVSGGGRGWFYVNELSLRGLELLASEAAK